MNIWNLIYLNCGERYEDIDHRSYTHNLSSSEIKAWKKSGLNGIWTHDLCDTGPVLYQLGSNPVQAWIFLGFNFSNAWVVCVTAMIKSCFHENNNSRKHLLNVVTVALLAQ